MTRNSTRRIGVLFGGRSVEHEVSIITGIQAAMALDETVFKAVPVYISKDGDWYTGAHLLELDSYKDLKTAVATATHVVPVSTNDGGIHLVTERRKVFGRGIVEHADAILVAMHGSEGENGALQGALEILNVAYTGSDVTASSIGMDKSLSKTLARSAGVPVLTDIVVKDSDWIGHEDDWLAQCEDSLGFPVIVKPMRLGSSIGIAVAETRTQLESILEETFRLDSRALVEPCIVRLREFNCSVLDRKTGPEASVIEEPVRTSGADLLSFEQKYQRGSGKGSAKPSRDSSGMASLDRLIPATVPGGRDDYLKDLAVTVFSAIGCRGVARIDFLYDEDGDCFYFNEINTIPGSFSFYLWEPSGIPFDRLLTELIDGAIREHRSRNAKVRSYDTNLLSENAMSGIKG